VSDPAAATISIDKDPTTTTVSANVGSSTFGDPVTFTATVSGSVVTDGTVTFKDDSTVLASGISLNGLGQASSPTSSLGAGTHHIIAVYSGADNFAGSDNSGSPLTFMVSKTDASASIVLNNLNQTYDGTPRVVTATTTPSGLTVNFTYDG